MPVPTSPFPHVQYGRIQYGGPLVQYGGTGFPGASPSPSIVAPVQTYNFLVINLPTDSGHGDDLIEGVGGGVTPIPPPSLNTLVDVYWSILQNLSNAGFIPTNSWQYVINPESPDDPWPSIPVPFVMLEPMSVSDTGNQVGAGRFGLIWEVDFKAHIVVGQILDSAWQDSNIVTSYDQTTGPYSIVDSVINVMCQSWPVNPLGQPTLIELPYITSYGSAYRNKKASDYTTVPITFRCTYREELPAILP